MGRLAFSQITQASHLLRFSVLLFLYVLVFLLACTRLLSVISHTLVDHLIAYKLANRPQNAIGISLNFVFEKPYKPNKLKIQMTKLKKEVPGLGFHYLIFSFFWILDFEIWFWIYLSREVNPSRIANLVSSATV